MPFSRSRSIESRTRSATSWFSRNAPGLPQHRVDERRLAVVDVRHDGDVAEVLAEMATSPVRALSRAAERHALRCRCDRTPRAAELARDRLHVVRLLGATNVMPDAGRARRGRCGRRGARSPRGRAGASKLITWVMPSTSMPRAATSVATSVSTPPRLEARQRALALAPGTCRRASRRRRRRGRARRLTSRSAPRLVRTKTSVQPALAPAAPRRARRAWPRARTGTKRCSTSPRAALGGACSWRRGVARVARGDAADLAVERGREEQRLAALGRGSATMRSTAGRKPMSSIRSASSRTRIRTCASETAPRSIRSSRRPGRGDERCAALRAASALALDAGAAVDGGDREGAGVSDRAELVDDLAGQLAGRDEDQRRGRGGRSPRCGRRAGSPKASVLPEPVGDLASTSWPASTSPMTRRWTGTGW